MQSIPKKASSNTHTHTHSHTFECPIEDPVLIYIDQLISSIEEFPLFATFTWLVNWEHCPSSHRKRKDPVTGVHTEKGTTHTPPFATFICLVNWEHCPSSYRKRKDPFTGVHTDKATTHTHTRACTDAPHVNVSKPSPPLRYGKPEKRRHFEGLKVRRVKVSKMKSSKG